MPFLCYLTRESFSGDAIVHNYPDEGDRWAHNRCCQCPLVGPLDAKARLANSPPSGNIHLSVSSHRQALFHLKSMFAFRLILDNPPFFEEDICGIVHGARAAMSRTMLVEEVVEHLRLNPFRRAGRVQLCLHVSAELSLRYARLCQVRVNLAADLQTSMSNR